MIKVNGDKSMTIIAQLTVFKKTLYFHKVDIFMRFKIKMKWAVGLFDE